MKRVNLGVWKLFTRHNYSGVNALARRALSRDHGRKENKYRTDWREFSELSSIQYFFLTLLSLKMGAMSFRITPCFTSIFNFFYLQGNE